MKKIENKTLLIWVLVVLLVLAGAYICNGIYQQKQAVIYQNGARLGYEQAVIQVMQQASTCKQVPLSAQNVTMNLIAVECLKQDNEAAVKTK